MSSESEQLAAAVREEAIRRLRENKQKIEHCLEQFSEDQIWWRPQAAMNSAGNLVLHVCGNLRQWLVSGITDQPDHRDRPAEFADRKGLRRDGLMRHLSEVSEEVEQALKSISLEELLRLRRIQGFDVTGLGAIFDSLPHMSGHTQEIVHLARIQLGEQYQFAWQPSSPEEGAPE